MEKVIVPVSDVLRKAIEEFVAAKRAMNSPDPKPSGFSLWVKSLAPQYFIDQYFPGWACWPNMTLKALLPFFESDYESDSASRYALVPVKSVVGSSWRWSENELANPNDTIEEEIEHFTSEKCTKRGSDRADVCLVKQLGLFYVSGEGKNRVAFLARHGEEWMPCQLSEQDYPESDRMEVIEVVEGPIRTWLCVLDSRFVAIIPYPELTIPILNAYGVSRKKEWQECCGVTLLMVMESFRSQPEYRDKGMRSSVGKAVDMKRLAFENHTEIKFKKIPLILFLSEIVDFKISSYLSIIAILIISIFVLLLLLPPAVSNLLVVGVVGVLMGFLGVLCIPIRVRRESVFDI